MKITTGVLLALVIGLLIGYTLGTDSMPIAQTPPSEGSGEPLVTGPQPNVSAASDQLLAAIQARVSQLEEENASLIEELAQSKSPRNLSALELLEALLLEPGEVAFNTELYLRAQDSDSPFIKALAMEVKLYEHYSPADAEKVALGAVDTLQLSPAGLIAARYLGEHISTNLRKVLHGAFSGQATALQPAGNWLVATALYDAGDHSYMALWSNAVETEIVSATTPTAELVSYMEACSLRPMPETEGVLLAASRSPVAAMRLLSIGGLRKCALYNPEARDALVALSSDSTASIRDKATVALRILDAGTVTQQH